MAPVLHLLGARPKLPAVASASLREEESIEERIQALMDVDGLSREAAVAHLEAAAGWNTRLDWTT